MTDRILQPNVHCYISLQFTNILFIYTIYSKLTYTDRYLHNNSNHHLSQKEGMIKIWVERAREICEPENLSAKLNHLKNALKTNRYLYPKNKQEQKQKDKSSKSKAFLPYISTNNNPLSVAGIYCIPYSCG